MKRKLFSGSLGYDRRGDRWYIQNYEGEQLWLSAGDSVEIGNVYSCSMRAVLSRVGESWMWTVPIVPECKEGFHVSKWIPHLDQAA